MSHCRKYSLTRLVPPASEPVTLSEAKTFLRIDSNTEDALIGDLIATARISAEEFTGHSLITQSWRLAYDDDAPIETPLPRGPVQSITAVRSIARDGTPTTISSAIYFLNAAKDALFFDTHVQGVRVEIDYSAGYGAASDIPKAIKQGMLAHIAALYDAREDSGKVPMASAALYHPFRTIRI